MKRRDRIKLEYYVYIADFNTKQIKHYNVLAGTELIDKLYKNKNKIKNREEFKEIVRRYLSYHFWSKSEYETIICGLFSDKEEKIDPYKQIEPNLDIIVDYIIKETEFKFVDEKN